MKEDKEILEYLPKGDGMTVPEGYFTDFAARMAESLPTTPFEENKHVVQPRTFWQRVRPYVYMAAMFAGVWCMLKMFSLMSGPSDPMQVPANLSRALQNESFVNEYVLNDISQWDILDQMMEDGFDLTELDDEPAIDDVDIIQDQE